MAAPLPIAFLQGRFLPLSEARISPLDRGFLFGDAVYEVLPVYDGRPFLFVEHAARLERSLEAIRMQPPLSRREFASLCTELVARNGGGDMSLYLQISRGAEAGREHRIPRVLAPTLFMMASPLAPTEAALLEGGVAAITLPDPRWKRCDIKSTALLANILARSAAVDAGATEAILLDGEWLREGASSAVLVVRGGALCAPPYGPEILPSTTRDLVLKLALTNGIALKLEPLAAAALKSADEILIGFATRGLLPVTRLDGATVGSGRAGPVFARLRAAFDDYRRAVAGTPLLPPD
jgi:D-alanine transaminase